MSKDIQKLIVCLVLQFTILTVAAQAQTTMFTYQGRLTEAGTEPSGQYQFQFKLFTAAAGGSQVGETLSDVTAMVSSGVFTVQLDFGANAFSGGDRFLEIAVRRNSSENYTTLSPRQQVAASPYAIRTLSASFADTATNALNLGGIPANQFVTNTDSRLSDWRNPLPGSGSYVQNTSTQQAGTNFNISGNGTLGGLLSAATVNSTNGYNIGGFRAFTASFSAKNVYVGFNTSGSDNTGNSNTFVGSAAGISNTTGSGNTFIGNNAGSAFGQDNTTGSNNTFIGFNSRPLMPNLTNATAIGTGSGVRTSDSLVLGNSSTKVGIGTDAPKTKLHLASGYLYIDDPSYGIVFKVNATTCRLLKVFENGTVTSSPFTCP